MKNTNESHRRGHVTADDALDGVELTHKDKPRLRQHDEPYRIGSLVDKKMEEGEEPGEIADMNDEEVRNAAIEEFAGKIKNAVSAKLMGKKINLKLKGNKELVAQVVKMIQLEADYLNGLISGQASDTPANQKNKAIIDMEAKKLDRMLATSDFWPFK
jgi:hypothetical protein